jgi:hypothetical protein
VTVKTKKPSYHERLIKRLKNQLEGQNLLRLCESRDHERAKAHSAQVLSEYLGKIRRYEEALTNNNVSITELQSQVATQARMLAEAQQDGANAIAAHNKMVTRLREAVTKRDDLQLEITSLMYQLTDAEQTLQYRVYKLLVRGLEQVRSWSIRQVERLKIWRKIRRLSAQRISALNAAGYIPNGLVKMAIKYHEYDQNQVKEQRNAYDYSGVQPTKTFEPPVGRIRSYFERMYPNG